MIELCEIQTKGVEDGGREDDEQSEDEIDLEHSGVSMTATCVNLSRAYKCIALSWEVCVAQAAAGVKHRRVG